MQYSESSAPPTDPKFQEVTVMITGATSGIGRATAQIFAKHNYSLVLTGRRTERLEEEKVRCLKLGAPNVQILNFDLTSKEQTLIALNELPAPDVLINNAGLALGKSSFLEGSLEDYETMIETNFKAVVRITRLLLPKMALLKQAHLVNIGSVAGRWTYPGGHVYSATKFAITALSESLRMDLAGKNIRVTNIEPGRVETEFSEVRFNGNSQQAKGEYEGYTPLAPHDIAECIYWSVTRPAHINIQEMVIYPTAQASVTQISKSV